MHCLQVTTCVLQNVDSTQEQARPPVVEGMPSWQQREEGDGFPIWFERVLWHQQ